MSSPSKDGLESAALSAMQSSGQRVIEFCWNQTSYVLKRIEEKPRSSLKLFLLTLLCRIFFRPFVIGRAMSPGDGGFEAKRIQNLAEQGVDVPKVVSKLKDAIIYQYCGLHLRAFLSKKSPKEQLEWIGKAVLDLAKFHHAGHWHGGAQFRNVLVHENDSTIKFCRIDFEEDLGEQFSLSLLQVYDLCLFMIDAMSFLTKEDKDQLSTEWLKQYQKIHWSPQHQEIFQRMAIPARFFVGLRKLIIKAGKSEGLRVLDLSSLICRSLSDQPRQCI